MPLDWEQVVVDARDPQALGHWWAEALGWVITTDSHEELEIRPTADSTPGILFTVVEGAKTGKNRVHPDFRPVDQQAEVERLLAMGARRADIGQGEQPWVVLLDPEGNELCILSPVAADDPPEVPEPTGAQQGGRCARPAQLVQVGRWIRLGQSVVRRSAVHAHPVQCLPLGQDLVVVQGVDGDVGGQVAAAVGQWAHLHPMPVCRERPPSWAVTDEMAVVDRNGGASDHPTEQFLPGQVPLSADLDPVSWRGVRCERGRPEPLAPLQIRFAEAFAE